MLQAIYGTYNLFMDEIIHLVAILAKCHGHPRISGSW